MEAGSTALSNAILKPEKQVGCPHFPSTDARTLWHWSRVRESRTCTVTFFMSASMNDSTRPKLAKVERKRSYTSGHIGKCDAVHQTRNKPSPWQRIVAAAASGRRKFQLEGRAVIGRQ